MTDAKMINDPVFGFIKIPSGLLLDIVNHPLFQRLARIKQMGLSSMVYPGAQHTRFLHSIGAYHLMSEALLSLSQKGVFIFDSEAEAVEAAILMHDMGHGPFSHVLENTLIHGISHERISLLMMDAINQEMGGGLNLAINIFKGAYPKRFLHQLISSQLDMDRLDYLRRDSFFTGVSEGTIGSARIIKMLNVSDDKLVVEQKGIYSIEHYLTARRLMYWQVYLHKTAVGLEKALVGALLRARYLLSQGASLFAPPHLLYFLTRHIDEHSFLNDNAALHHYAHLDDSDIWCAVKTWCESSDLVLRLLAHDLIDRHPFKVEVSDEPFSDDYIEETRLQLQRHYQVSASDSHYLMSVDSIHKDMYDMSDDHISILLKDGSTKDIEEVSEIFNFSLLSKKNRKYYLCYQRF